VVAYLRLYIIYHENTTSLMEENVLNCLQIYLAILGFGLVGIYKVS